MICEGELDDWQVIDNKPSFKLKSHWNNLYCNTRRFAKITFRIYQKGAKGIKLLNHLIWLNYSMYPYLPPKLAFSMSIVLVCVFLVTS